MRSWSSLYLSTESQLHAELGALLGSPRVRIILVGLGALLIDQAVHARNRVASHAGV